MYAISKGPSKLVAKTRRGLPQNFEKIESMREMNRKLSENNDDNEIVSGPKPVFQNAKKTISHQMYKSAQNNNEDAISPQHEELIKYIYESWNMIALQNPYESMSSASSSSSECSTPSSPSSSISSTTSSVYYVDTPSPELSDFKPFDLESWWGRRLFNNITKSL